MTTEITNLHWYALYTRPRHEKKVYDQLVEKGVTSFLPLIEQVRQWKDRKKRIMMPLFSSYVFVRIHLKDRYTDIKIRKLSKRRRFGRGYPWTIQRNPGTFTGITRGDPGCHQYRWYLSICFICC